MFLVYLPISYNSPFFYRYSEFWPFCIFINLDNVCNFRSILAIFGRRQWRLEIYCVLVFFPSQDPCNKVFLKWRRMLKANYQKMEKRKFYWLGKRGRGLKSIYLLKCRLWLCYTASIIPTYVPLRWHHCPDYSWRETTHTTNHMTMYKSNNSFNSSFFFPIGIINLCDHRLNLWVSFMKKRVNLSSLSF